MTAADISATDLKAIASGHGVEAPTSTDPLTVATDLMLRLYRHGELPRSVKELAVLAYAAKVRGRILLETSDSVETGMSSLRTSALASFLSGAETDRHDDHLALGLMYHLLDLPEQANEEFLAAHTAGRRLHLESAWDEIPHLPPGSEERDRRIGTIEGFAPYIFSEEAVRAREERVRREAELAEVQRAEQQERERVERERAEREAAEPALHAKNMLGLLLADPDSQQTADLLSQFQRQLEQLPPADAADLVTDGALQLIHRQESPWLTMKLLAESVTWCGRAADYRGLVWALVETALRLRASGSHESLFHAYECASEATRKSQFVPDFAPRARSAGVLALLFLDARQPAQAVDAISQVTAVFPESSLTDDDDRRLMARLLVVYAKALAGLAHETGDQSHMDDSTTAVTQAYSLFGLVGEPDGLNATRAELGI